MLVSNTKPTGSPSVLYTYIATEKAPHAGRAALLPQPAPRACPIGGAVESGEWPGCDDLFSRGGRRNIEGVRGATTPTSHCGSDTNEKTRFGAHAHRPGAGPGRPGGGAER